ncbi:hypothetical protein [Bernardetia sp. MNP-M8]|uniref:hypothetical protein n=1 Tax=Bernardetia sp. MNP-M8 TaxID=3127470 RepID=UPI0030CEA11D
MSNKEEKLDIFKFLPTAFLGICIILSVLINLISDYTLDYKEYIGFGIAIVGISLFFIRVVPNKIYAIYTFLMIILGVFNVVSFSIYHLVFTLNSISFQIIPCIALCIYFYAFRKDIKKNWENIVREIESSKIEQQSKQKINFKRKFEKLSDKEIERRINQGLTLEAITALEEIQLERKESNKKNTL